MTPSEATHIAETILTQLGAARFIAMTGSKHFMSMVDGSLLFHLGRNSGKANRCRITLTPRDTYSVRFYTQRLNKKTLDVSVKEVAQYDDVYADQLQDIFTHATGLYTSLGTLGAQEAQ